MLRINLLPIKQLKKRAQARNQIFGFFLVFCAVIVALGFVGILQAGKVDNLQASIDTLKQKEKRLAPTLKKVDMLIKQQKELQNKIDIIKKLRRESSLTVHVLDEVANIIDNDRMWLTSLNQQGSTLNLQGVALDNQTVAQFMESLEKSDYIKNVRLTNSTLQKVSNRAFKSFGLACGVGFPVEKSPSKDAVNN